MAAPTDNLRINPDRLWDSIHALAEIGPGKLMVVTRLRDTGIAYMVRSSRWYSAIGLASFAELD